MQHGIGVARAPDRDRAQREAAGERQAPQHAAVLDDEGAVVQHEVEVEPEPLDDAPRRGMAAPRHQHDAHAAGARLQDGGQGPGRDGLVAAQQRPVDVEGEQAVARRPRP